MKKLIYLIVLALILGLVLTGSSQSLLDSVNIGDTASEAVHNPQGWTLIWTCGPYSVPLRQGNWCACDADGNMRLIWGDGDETCDLVNNWASVDLDAGDGTLWAKNLKVEHLDGAADDGFDVYVNDNWVGEYVADMPNTKNVWHVTDFDISSWNFSGLLTIEFVATASAWGGCPTYGQVAFNMIELYGENKNTVTIDIKPGSDPNSINLKEQGVLPVAILSSSIDVYTIDPETITLGGTGVTSRGGGAKKAPKLAVSFEDVDGDGFMDLIAFFRVEDLVIAGALDEITEELILEAVETTGGLPICGIDTVNVVP